MFVQYFCSNDAFFILLLCSFYFRRMHVLCKLTHLLPIRVAHLLACLPLRTYICMHSSFIYLYTVNSMYFVHDRKRFFYIRPFAHMSLCRLTLVLAPFDGFSKTKQRSTHKVREKKKLEKR